MTYEDILYGRPKDHKEGVASFRATWPNGNEPDGETTVTIDVVGGETEDGKIGYILTCDDNNCGGDSREAGDSVYVTSDEAIAAANSYAAEHDER